MSEFFAFDAAPTLPPPCSSDFQPSCCASLASSSPSFELAGARTGVAYLVRPRALFQCPRHAAVVGMT